MTPVFNRDFEHPADGWYMIEPKGEHPNARANVIQVIDEIAADTIVNHFNDQGPNFPGMLVDHEHFSQDPDKETVAYGWLTKLANRNDGIYGQIRWSDRGQKAVDGGEYRYFSTEYLPAECEILNTSKPRQIRPMRLAGLSLTNRPNNHGGKPITNRQPIADPAPAASATPKPHIPNNRMKNIAAKLGLAAEASEDAILTALNVILNARDEAAKQLEPLTNHVKELETQKAALETAVVEGDLETFKDRIHAPQKDFIKGLLLTNRAATIEYLKGLPVLRQVNAGVVVNRAAAKTPVDNTAAKEPDLRAVVEDYRIKNRCSFKDAWEAVKREKPELFVESNDQ
jgi:phage I-like protein